MIHKNIIFLLYYFPLVNFSSINGQNLNSDSILKKIIVLPDTTKINILKNKCWKLRNKNPKIALQLCEKALEISETDNLKEYRLGILNFLGVVYLKLGKLDSAYLFYQEVLNQSKLNNDSIQIGYAYNNLGDFYFEKASYTLALENVLSAYNIFNALDNKKGVAYCKNNIGEIYIKQNRLDKAINVLTSALELRLKEEDEKGISKTKLNIASVYTKQENYAEALTILRDLLDKNDEIGYLKGKGAVLEGLSDIYYAKKNYPKALKCRNEAMAISKEISDVKGEIANNNKLGLICKAMEKYTLAEKIFLDVKSTAKSAGYLEQEMESNKHLSDLKSEQTDFKAALNYKNEYIKLREVIYGNINIGELIDLETAYDKIKQEKKVLILERKINADKLMQYLLVAGLLFFAVAIIFMIYEWRNKKKANEVLLKLNDSKDMFFSILAHDLKGPIVNIKTMTSLLNSNYAKLKEDNIVKMIDLLDKSAISTHNLLTKLLAWSSATTGRTIYNPVSFNLEEELDHTINLLSDIAQKKSIKFNKKFDSNNLVFADREMVSTILRNLITNAIKFSYSNSNINIYSATESKHIEIAVADNGVGIDTDEINRIFRIGYRHTKLGTNNEKGTGIGLTLCAELIKINKGNIRIISEPEKGSKFIFSLPKSRNTFSMAALV